MMRYNNLKQRPRHFQTFTGLTVSEFNKLIKENKDNWKKQRIERLLNNHPNRKRKIGGGRKKILNSFEDQLLLSLVWAKLYPTYLLLEYFFNIDESTAFRAIQETTLLLKGRFALPEQRGVRKGKKIATIEELREIIPNLDEVLADVTEQKIPRPKKKQKRKNIIQAKRKLLLLKNK